MGMSVRCLGMIPKAEKPTVIVGFAFLCTGIKTDKWRRWLNTG